MITGTGFSMNIHYCGGEMQDIAFWSNEVTCEMMAAAKKANPCPMHAVVASDCCENKDIEVKAEDPESYLTSTIHISLDWTAVTTSSITYSVDLPHLSEKFVYNTYRPPPIERDIPVLVQSFLI
jgi:hypothetical protein